MMGSDNTRGGSSSTYGAHHHHTNAHVGDTPAHPELPASSTKSRLIREVWAANLEEEFRIIRELVVDYPYIAMDTEFPGVVARPVGNFASPQEKIYPTLRINVNLLRVIQIGITLMNERGEVPEQYCTWQFNFRFSLANDIHAVDSIDLLKHGGINFDHLNHFGIEAPVFADLLMSSGLVLMPDVHWIVFHGAYDFGYLLRLLTQRELPDRDEDFTAQLRIYFPNLYDIKFILRETDIMHQAGLDYLADSLSIRRVGVTHQAGSDSLMTGHCFFKLIRDRLNKVFPRRSNGILYSIRDGAADMTPATLGGGGGTGAGGISVGRAFPSTPTGPTSNSGATPTTSSPAGTGGGARPGGIYIRDGRIVVS